MRLRSFYCAPDEGASGGGDKPPEPAKPPAAPPAVAAELKALEKEAKKIEAQVSKGEISGMSESTGHAILENLKAINARIESLEKKKSRGFFGF